MAKKQKSFADKAAGNASGDSVYVKYVKSVQSEETGRWRFNEQMIRMNKGEQLDAALKRMDEAANLVDIDLSEFVISSETDVESVQDQQPSDSVDVSSNEDSGDNEKIVLETPESDSEDNGSSEEE
tara:strand:+ start:1194 stop:1571 length:378 start_codon:yes stop_codon:yes gene_type:complete